MTYSQISRAASLSGRRISIVDIDADGIIPDESNDLRSTTSKDRLLDACGQNPTCSTLPLERRKAIVEIAHRHNVWIVEDNLYGAMTGNELPLIAELAPDRTFLVNGLSKSVSAGLRGGWVACPPAFVTRIRVAHKMLTGGIPFLMAELSARLVISGDADAIPRHASVKSRRDEV